MPDIAVNVNADYLEDIRYDDPSVPIHFCMDYFDTLVDHEINVHWHHDFEFAVMLRGACDYHLGGESVRLGPGDGVFVNSETLHSADNPTSGAVMSCVTFSPLFLTGQPSGTIYRDQVLPVMNRPFVGLRLPRGRCDDILDEIRALAAIGGRDATAPLEYVEHVARLWRLTLAVLAASPVTESGDAELRRERRMRTMIAYVQRHYADDIGPADIAASANIGRTECFRLFRRHTGGGAGEYLLNYRLRRAAAMLVTGDEPIGRVARLCGFMDASHFSRRFREHYGLSPREYRRLDGFQRAGVGELRKIGS